MKVFILLLMFISSSVFADATRRIEADEIITADKTKTFSLPSATDTIVGRLSTDTLTNKTINGSNNTLSNVPMGSTTGTLAIANGGTGETVANNALNSLLPDQTLANGKVLQSDGTNTSWQTAGSGANTSLSNLTSPTAVNFGLFPNGALTLGQNGNNWTQLWVDEISIGESGGAVKINWENTAGSNRADTIVDSTTPLGTTVAWATYGIGLGQNVALATDVSATSGGSGTGQIYLQSGNLTNAASSGTTGIVHITTGNAAGSGNSGLIEIKTGTSGSGVRGQITADSGLLNVSSGIAVRKVTADPCADTVLFPESTQFYNDTSDYYCFCDGAGADVQMHAPATACF